MRKVIFILTLLSSLANAKVSSVRLHCEASSNNKIDIVVKSNQETHLTIFDTKEEVLAGISDDDNKLYIAFRNGLEKRIIGMDGSSFQYFYTPNEKDQRASSLAGLQYIMCIKK